MLQPSLCVLIAIAITRRIKLKKWFPRCWLLVSSDPIPVLFLVRYCWFTKKMGVAILCGLPPTKQGHRTWLVMNYMAPFFFLKLIFIRAITKYAWKRQTFQRQHSVSILSTMRSLSCRLVSNALATFQTTMNDIFRSYLRMFVLIFCYDIFVYNKTWEDHPHHLEVVLQTLQHYQFSAIIRSVFWAKNCWSVWII